MILLVEDDRGISALEERALTEASFKVQIVESGAEALGAIASDSVDLVVLDYRLPDMTGLDVLEAMGERTNELPVIVVTGLAIPTLERKLLAAGARRFIVKDMNLTFPHRIVAAANELISMRTTGRREARRHLPGP